MKKEYAKAVCCHVDSFKLLFDGKKIKVEDTPTKLKIENRDVVDCLLEQMGD